MHLVQPIIKSICYFHCTRIPAVCFCTARRVFSTIVINFLLTGSALIVFPKVKQYILSKRRLILRFDSTYCGQDNAEVSSFKTSHVLRPSLFWDVKQRRLVVGYGSFGTAYQSHHRGSASCTETSATNYLPTRRNIAEIWRSQLRGCESLKSRDVSCWNQRIADRERCFGS